MHIPDGYLDPLWCAVLYAAVAAYGFVAWRRSRTLLGPETLAALTVVAAGVFVAMMFNWPLPGGTSLHFVGGALTGILLGPWLAFYVYVIVLAVQALVFHDGGVTTLGANIFNMGVVDVVVGYAVYRLALRVAGFSRRGRLVASFLAGWLGLAAAGTMAGLEIGLSPSFPYGVAISVPVMAAWHTALGVVEGAITAMVLDYLYERRSPLLEALRPVSAVGVDVKG